MCLCSTSIINRLTIRFKITYLLPYWIENNWGWGISCEDKVDCFIYMIKNMIGNANRWENYESVRPGGSLIVSMNTSPHHVGVSPKPAPKYKLDDLYQRQQMLVRHSSEEEFKRFNQRINVYPSPEAPRMEELNYRGGSPMQMDKNINLERLAYLRKGSSKDHEKEVGFFNTRNSGGRANNRLKQTASTTNTEQLQTYKSEKTLPSFLRNQTKSPERGKWQRKGGLSKDSFKIIKRLGQGKFGIVSLARQIYTGMIVALKVMNKKKIMQDNLLVQFIRELKIQSFLDHPNIIKTFAYFADEDNFYTVLELGCDGQLYDVISTGQTLSEESTSFIIGNLLDAVCLMHRHKILHRDIKPENIVLVHGNVKLCDFGWAVNKKEELRATFCGTPLYLSPELLQGERYDEKVDLWAVGILAYELHLGTSPFNISQQQDLVKIVTDEVEFPQNKKVSKEFKDFITAILKKNPKERLPSKELLGLEFIRRYRDLETCEELCN